MAFTGPAAERVHCLKASPVAPASLMLICTSNVLAGMLAASISITTVAVEVAKVFGAAHVDSTHSCCVAGLMRVYA